MVFLTSFTAADFVGAGPSHRSDQGLARQLFGANRTRHQKTRRANISITRVERVPPLGLANDKTCFWYVLYAREELGGRAPPAIRD